jgi:phosphonoacetate hydrolase
MAAGVKLLEEFNPDIMYLSTTDFIQHKYAPGDKEANDFYQMFDKYVSKICSNGNSVVITADHGMKSKANINGEPNAIFLQDYLDDQMGKDEAKVILPITDPYVVHHGSLGSFATIYVKDKSKIDETISKISSIKEIEVVVKQDEACREYRLPSDRIGDIICMSTEDMTIGTSKANHDLSKLKEPLRSHGGHHEREVPFISNKKLNIAKDQSLNNYDAFFYAINGA